MSNSKNNNKNLVEVFKTLGNTIDTYLEADSPDAKKNAADDIRVIGDQAKNMINLVAVVSRVDLRTGDLKRSNSMIGNI